MQYSILAIWAFVWIFNVLPDATVGAREIVDIVGLVLIFIAGFYPLSPWYRP